MAFSRVNNYNVKQKIMNWITESNRQKHFLYAIPCAFLFTILFVAGLAAGMEFKDKEHGGKWDWLDLLATVLGGFVGQICQVTVFYLLKMCFIDTF